MTAQKMGEYWSRPREMFARAFESYVEDELKARGMKNTYLVSGTKHDDWNNHAAAKLASHGITPSVWPTGKERQAMSKAIKELMAAMVETRTIEKAIQVLSRPV